MGTFYFFHKFSNKNSASLIIALRFSSDSSTAAAASLGCCRVLEHLVGEEVGEESNRLIILQNGLLASLSRRCLLRNFPVNDALLELLGQLLLLLFFGVLGHLVQHTRHLSRALVHIDGIVLLSLLISEDLQALRAAIRFLPLLILNHHVLVLLGEHFPGGQVDGDLSLEILLLLCLGLSLQRLHALLVLSLSKLLHFHELVLLFF